MLNQAHRRKLYCLVIVLISTCSAAVWMHARAVPPAFRGIFTRGYSEWELKQIARFEGPIDELSNTWPIEYTYQRSTDTRVFYVGPTGVTCVCFDEEGQFDVSHYRKWSKPLQAFEALQVGTDMMSVYEMDPNGHYPFFTAGDPMYFSAHYTSDGYYVSISYGSESEQSGCLESISVLNLFGFPEPTSSFLMQ